MATDLTDEAQAGQKAARGVNLPALPPYMFSSPAWLGYMAGTWVAEHSDVVNATAGRGYSVNVLIAGSEALIVSFSGKDLETVRIERKG